MMASAKKFVAHRSFCKDMANGREQRDLLDFMETLKSLGCRGVSRDLRSVLSSEVVFCE